MGNRMLLCGALAFLAGGPDTCLAVGFAIPEQSVVGLGYGFAGLAANPEDASTIYFNPAGLSYLKDREVSSGMSAIDITARFSDSGSQSPAGSLSPLTGGNGGNPIGLNWIPNMYVAVPSPSGLSLGLGIGAPFGLKTEYPRDWLGRYQAATSDLKSINVNPSLSFKVGSSAFGLGINFQYLKAELGNAIDFGAACFGSPFTPTGCLAGGIVPQGADGFVAIEGDSWAFGANAGWMLQVGERSFVGISYRMPMRHKLSGDARFSLPRFPPPYSALTAGVTDSGAKADITLPGLLSFGGRAQLTPALALLADLAYTEWSRFDELRIRFDSGAPDAVIPAHWKNTWRGAVGIAYDSSTDLILRAGVTHEPSTIPDNYRTARVPDNAQTLVGVGFAYRVARWGWLDVGYGRVWVKDAPVNNTIAGAGTLRGTYQIRADVFGVQFRAPF